MAALNGTGSAVVGVMAYGMVLFYKGCLWWLQSRLPSYAICGALPLQSDWHVVILQSDTLSRYVVSWRCAMYPSDWPPLKWLQVLFMVKTLAPASCSTTSGPGVAVKVK